MPPLPRPYPRFIADSPQEGKPYGRWEERLRTSSPRRARSTRARRAGRWTPGRSSGFRSGLGRTRLRPGDRRGSEGEAATDDEPAEGPVEYFGWVSFERPEDGEPSDLPPGLTSPTSPPRTTPTGRSTSPTMSSVRGARRVIGAATSRSFGACRWCGSGRRDRRARRRGPRSGRGHRRPLHARCHRRGAGVRRRHYLEVKLWDRRLRESRPRASTRSDRATAARLAGAWEHQTEAGGQVRGAGVTEPLHGYMYHRTMTRLAEGTSEFETVHHVELHRHHVSYRTAGSGPVILLVHGVAGTSEQWADVDPCWPRSSRSWRPTCSGTASRQSRRATIRSAPTR